MLQSVTQVTPGRHLLVDGDALCYVCAGSDDTAPAQARINLFQRIERATAASGAEAVRILVTARDSHKGHRYAVAVAKPYQGQRKSGRRPKNWEFLRKLLEDNTTLGPKHWPIEATSVAEADDLFSQYAHRLGWDNVVIHTQDKDMRMIPGLHLTWDDFHLFAIEPTEWAKVRDDKVYGRKWFWLQMLHGDTADNVPGLPKWTRPDGKQALCGEVTAGKLLAETTSEADALVIVRPQYRLWYGPEDGDTAMLEQGILLWMRRHAGNVFDVCEDGGPLFGIPEAAKTAIKLRIAGAQACLPS